MLRLRFGNILAGGDIVAGLKLWKFLVEIKPNAEVAEFAGAKVVAATLSHKKTGIEFKRAEDSRFS
jgi:hypothetical protein